MHDGEQHQLFEPADNPLEERLGTDFFDELPTTPGVYKMYGQSGRLLYVGKAKNLRNRLFTYRRVTSDHSSRKTKRLVQMIRRIELHHCKNEEEALLTENRLIRKEKPEFNRAKKSPETYYFLTLAPDPEKHEVAFQLTMKLPEDREIIHHTYGAFKGHRTIRAGTGALLRQLYLMEYHVQSLFDFPTVLTNNLTPLAYQLSLNEGLVLSDDFEGRLNDFLAGKSIKLLERIIELATDRGILGEYIGSFILKDCESLKYLYEQCLQRNWELRQTLQLEDRLIPQDKLDDYLIRAAFKD